MERIGEDASVLSPSPSIFADATQVPLEAGKDGFQYAMDIEDARAERRLKDAVRRYYALAELIETERGYVDDLKILVEVYLTSLGAIPEPILDSRSESQPVAPPDFTDGTEFASEPSTSRRQTHSYQYPPSAFPSGAMLKEHVEMKPRTRVRPASLQMLSVLQPYSIRSRKNSGPDPCPSKAARRNGGELDRVEILGTRGVTHESGSASSSSSSVGFGSYSQARSIGFEQDSSLATSSCGIRRASIDAGMRAKPAYGDAFTSSPESSPRLSPAISPSGLPSIPSTPLSSLPTSPLPTPSQVSLRHQRLRASLSVSERHTLARDAQDILTLHRRIVGRVEDTLRAAQRGVQERRRALKGKDKAANERSQVEYEVNAAVRAVCSVFISEAPNFALYEVFCAGHTEALEAVRRIIRGHGNDWAEWEKHCANVAIQRDDDGVVGPDAEHDSPLPSPLVRPVQHSGSRNSLLSGVTPDVEDANSSTSTLRRRHSACASTGSLRASASASLKHTKSDPTPPAAHNHAHAYGFANSYSSLSVKGLASRQGGLSASRLPNAARNEKERQRERGGRTKLAFADYLIKPVQRLCKYPLLFEQLRSSRKREIEAGASATPKTSSMDMTRCSTATTSLSAKHVTMPVADEAAKGRKGQAAFRLGGDSDEEDDEIDENDFDNDEDATDSIIERVLGKMREVAHAVDEAQRRRDIEKKSALIVERLVAGSRNADHRLAPVPVPGSDFTDEENDTEEGAKESRSELGHGVGTAGISTSVGSSAKPPARSLSFSTFTRSRSRNSIGRTNSALMQQQHLRQASELGGTRSRIQIPGPPTRAFLTSLGACLLAGSLDVVVASSEQWPCKSTLRGDGRRDSLLSIAGMSSMRSNNGLATTPVYVPQPSREPVKVKYLAAFLYVGGYIVLAKTPKAGVYEPRHWFALTDKAIEVVDVREEKALLPCSFHLIFHATGHRIELAAACQREKEIWLNAIYHARTLPPTWEYEPIPTLNVSASLVNGNSGRSSIDVPPVPSIPPLGDGLPPHLTPSRVSSHSTFKSDGTVKPNRRQSVHGAGVLGFFTDIATSAPPTVLIRRVSATRRAQTDRHLADVLSQPLLAARFHAKAHDEVLFRDPDPPHQGTGIGVSAMAKNRLMSRESVLVSKQYTPSVCSTVASSVGRESTISESVSNTTVQQFPQNSMRGKSTKKNRSRGSLSMLLTLPSAIEANRMDSLTSTPSPQGMFSLSSPLQSTSTSNSIDPLSQSQCSSASTSAPSPSPVNEFFPPEVRVVGVDALTHTEGEELPGVLDHVDRPKRSRSLMANFRGFFGTPRSLSSSPAPSLSSSRHASGDESLEVPGAESTPHKGVLSRIMSTSFRPRSRSGSNLGDSTQTFLSSKHVSDVHGAPTRFSFITRSSSMLAGHRRKPESSTPARVTVPVVMTPTPLPHLNTRPSRSSSTPAARSEMSLSRSIKYRLFPGNLVPLTPINHHPHDRLS